MRPANKRKPQRLRIVCRGRRVAARQSKPQAPLLSSAARNMAEGGFAGPQGPVSSWAGTKAGTRIVKLAHDEQPQKRLCLAERKASPQDLLHCALAGRAVPSMTLGHHIFLTKAPLYYECSTMVKCRKEEQGMSEKLRKLEQKKEALLKQIQAEKTKIAREERKQDDHRKFALGGMVIAEAEENAEFRILMEDILRRRVLKHHRKHFTAEFADRFPFTPLQEEETCLPASQKEQLKSGELKDEANRVGQNKKMQDQNLK